jgi:uncharacterized protein (TIGR02271 family)
MGKPASPAAPAADKPLFGGQRSEEARIPIVEEQVAIGKRTVETGRVRVHTVVDEEKLNLHELLERDVVEIERVPIGREVAQAPLPFEEGDTLIIPVVEERLIVEKRLVVVEEIRVRRRQERTETEVPVTRRVMRAEIERSGAEPHSAPSHGNDPGLPRSSPAAALRDHTPDQIRAGPSGATSPTPRHPARAGEGANWPLIVLGIALVLLLLLVTAGRS